MSNIMGRTCSMHGRHACSILGVMPKGKKALVQGMIYEAVLNVIVHFYAS
jgi:hypothetical protein